MCCWGPFPPPPPPPPVTLATKVEKRGSVLWWNGINNSTLLHARSAWTGGKPGFFLVGIVTKKIFRPRLPFWGAEVCWVSQLFWGPFFWVGLFLHVFRAMHPLPERYNNFLAFRYLFLPVSLWDLPSCQASLCRSECAQYHVLFWVCCPVFPPSITISFLCDTFPSSPSPPPHSEDPLEASPPLLPHRQRGKERTLMEYFLSFRTCFHFAQIKAPFLFYLNAKVHLFPLRSNGSWDTKSAISLSLLVILCDGQTLFPSSGD